MRIEYGSSQKASTSLASTMLMVFGGGWLLYLVLLLIAHHFFPQLDLDFWLHDNYPAGDTDRFRDFFEINRAATIGDCYLTGAGANYPPLALVIAKFLALFTPNVLSDATVYVTRDTFTGGMLFFAFFAFVTVLCHRIILSYFKKNLPEAKFDRTIAVILAIISMCSYSYLYAIERGNYIVVALAAFLVFVFTYNRNDILSAIALAICACIKVYPVALFILFLIDKKYNALFVGIITGLVGLFLPMFFLQGTLVEQFIGLLNGVLFFNNNSMASGGQVGFAYVEQHSNSFSNIFRAVALWLVENKRLLHYQNILVSFLSIVSSFGTILIVIMAVLIIRREKEFWKRVCVLLCLVHLLPSNTYDYMLTFFLPVLAVAVCKGKLTDRKYVVLLTLLVCVPKTYYFFPFGATDVSIQCVINPLLMVMILVELFLDSCKPKQKYFEGKFLDGKRLNQIHGEFDLNATNLCKAIAVCQMVYFHSISCTDASQYTVVIPLFKKLFGDFGNICVASFVFLSSYGYTIKSKRQHDLPNPLNHYFKSTVKRLKNLYNQYWFVFILAFLLSPLCSKGWMDFRVAYGTDGVIRPVLRGVLNFLGLTHLFYGDSIYTLNQTWWYFSLAIILIILIPLLIWVYRHAKIETLLVGIVLSVLFYNVKYMQYLPVVLIGIMAADMNLLEKINYCHKHYPSVKITEILVWGLLFIGWFDTRNDVTAVRWVPTWDAIITFANILMLFNFIRPLPILSKGLSFIGKHSANIFMIHSLFYIYYPTTSKIFYALEYDWLIWLTLLGVCLLASIVLEWLKKFIKWNQLFQI